MNDASPEPFTDPLADQPDGGESPLLPVVILLVDDLFFATRMEDVVRRLGGRPLSASSPEAFVQAMNATAPVLALVDLNIAGDWEAAIRRCKLLPHTRQTPIYAFGSHVNTDTLVRARKAGADHAWARSRMAEELVQVVEKHLQPPQAPVDGCQDPLPPEAVAGLEAFNRGEFFDQHEHLEAAWIAESRPVRALYQGILQIGLAFLQIEQGNWRGAVKMLRRGLPKLRALPDRCQGVDVASLRQAAERIHAILSRPEADSLSREDIGPFPQIDFVRGNKD